METYWWTGQATENLYMEITRREDIGVDLKAPLAARGGVETSGYALVGAVQEGDIVVHYDSAAEQIVGVSRATGERFKQPIWWAARGSYARKAGAKPEWLPGLYVALEGYRRLTVPLPLSVIRERQTDLFTIRDLLQKVHGRQSLYFPWIPYQDSMRTFQSYLAKLPRQVLIVLPEIAKAIDALLAEHGGDAILLSEIEEIERDFASAAGRPRPSRKAKGQGFASDQQVKVAVETHAMNAALLHYTALGDVTDTSRHESYDYEVDIAGAIWHVEVKGTTGEPHEILLTPREVEHAHQYEHVALFVLSNIAVTRTESGEVTVSGGETSVLHPWSLDRNRLAPIGYRYRLPET